jgi:hypothetical protein
VVQIVFGPAGDWGAISPTQFNAIYCVNTMVPGDPHIVDPGEFTLYTDEGTVSGTISGTVEAAPPPETGPAIDLEWTVTAGTERFTGATGTLVVTGTSAFAGGSVTATISGDIVIP